MLDKAFCWLLFFIFLSVVTSIAINQINRSNSVFAKTNYGPIEGFRHTSGDGSKSHVFLGIPFAKPPINELRFERPLAPSKWIWPRNSKNFQSACYPMQWFFIQNNVTYNEDCLYLNIIAPAIPSLNPKGYPVLVYIHGGGFVSSDVIRAGYDKATQNYARRGVILVTVPYRLGIYGFMSLGTKEDPGNIGMWDQIAALKFIKENIKYFGGNPNNIIAWGESAGASSVDLLSLSPHSRDLFQKVIQGSGCGINEWASSMPVKRVTINLAKAMGCNATEPAQIKAFLKAQTWDTILNVSSTFEGIEALPNYIGFAPRYDDDFFDGKTVEQLIQEAPPKPLIVGLMSLEAASFTNLRGKTPEEYATFTAQNLTEAIKATASEAIVGPEYQEIQDDIINYFVYDSALEQPDSNFYILRYAEFVSDYMFMQQVFNSTDAKVKRGWPIYFYLWNHISAPVQATLPMAKGGWHAAELFYTSDEMVFPMDVFGKPEYKVQKYYADIFATFAYTGKPYFTELLFPKYDLSTRKSLWIDPTLSIKRDFIGDRRRFWIEHGSKFNFNVLRGRTRQQIIDGSPLDDN